MDEENTSVTRDTNSMKFLKKVKESQISFFNDIL